MSLENFNQLLNEFGSGIGLEELAADSEGYCSLEVDGDQVLHLKYDEETDALRFFMELGFLPEETRDRNITDILDANVMCRGTGGCVLGVDSRTSTLTICFDERIEGMNRLRFEQLLNNFLSNAEIWTKRIQPAAAETSVADDTLPDHGNFAIKV